MCGWLKDRFGLSWQIVPTRLYELVSDPDPARADAATQAMLGMTRIVVADLEAAADAATPALPDPRRPPTTPTRSTHDHPTQPLPRLPGQRPRGDGVLRLRPRRRAQRDDLRRHGRHGHARGQARPGDALRPDGSTTASPSWAPTQPGDHRATNGSVSLSGDDDDTLRAWFAGLSEGGEVTMPLEVAPWGDPSASSPTSSASPGCSTSPATRQPPEDPGITGVTAWRRASGR